MTYFTFIIIGITSLVTFLAFKDQEFLDKNIFYISKITKNKEYHRIITSGFIHVNFAHFAFNMYSFYSFSSYMEMQFGIKPLFIIYFLSIIGGNIFALILNKKNPEYRAVGASGGVCGIIFSSIFLQPGSSIFLFFIPIPIPAWLFGIIFILISVYGIRNKTSNIGHEAHVGGALSGIVATFILFPDSVASQLNLLILILLPLAGFSIFSKLKKIF